jgi:hypothetical protein
MNPVHTTPFYFSKLNLLLSSHLRPALPTGLFPSAYPMKNLYAFIFSSMRATYMGKHAAHMEDLKKTHKILIGRPEGTRLLRIRLRYMENMLSGCVLNSSGYRRDPVAGWCEHGTEPSESTEAGDSLTRWATVSFSRKTLLGGVSL